MRGPVPGTPSTLDFHPLELIPFFRRWPCSPVRNIVYTFVWSSGLGVLFYLINLALVAKVPPFSVLQAYLVMANLVGYSIHVLFWFAHLAGLHEWVNRRGFFARSAYYGGLPTLGVVAGFQAFLVLFHLEVQHMSSGAVELNVMPPSRGLFSEPNWVVSVAATSMVISLMIAAVFGWRESRARAETERARERERLERVEREAVVANLRALQAQIEPHFLFNTLANVTSLIESEPRTARRMLESFIRFLRASLATTRTEETTLGAEAELIGAYLEVLQVRMGARLRYAIDIPAELRGFAIPPMLLQPVVENAIIHGLEPSVTGGEVAIDARREDGAVAIAISDSGAGFGATTHGGTGLTNIRDRLRALYGERAALAIAERPGGGARVTLRIPQHA